MAKYLVNYIEFFLHPSSLLIWFLTESPQKVPRFLRNPAPQTHNKDIRSSPALRVSSIAPHHSVYDDSRTAAMLYAQGQVCVPCPSAKPLFTRPHRLWQPPARYTDPLHLYPVVIKLSVNI